MNIKTINHNAVIKLLYKNHVSVLDFYNEFGGLKQAYPIRRVTAFIENTVYAGNDSHVFAYANSTNRAMS